MKEAKQKNRYYRLLIATVAGWSVLVMIVAFLIPVSAAEATYDCFKLTATSEGSVTIETTSTGWKVLAYGTDGACGSTSTQSVTLTITNTGTKSDGTVRAVSFSITTSGMDSNDVNVSKTLDATTTSLEYTATSGQGTSACTTITIDFLNVSQESLGTQITTIVQSGEGGTITVDGEKVDSQTEFINLDDHVYELTATADTGYDFFGWMSSNGPINTDGNGTISYAGKNAATIWPLFVKNGNAIFYVKGAVPLVYYSEFNAVIDAAGTSGVIVPIKDGKITSGEYTIPKGVTLLIPYDNNNTLCTTTPTVAVTYSGTIIQTASASSWVKPTAYRTLTLEEGTHITVNGAVSLSGTQCAYQVYNGMPTGSSSFLKMEKGSSITVNDGAFLYAWGYITGSGQITVKNGGTVYEDFQVKDWRGGSAASGMINKDQKVFPVSQYYVQNIEVAMTLEAGAEEYAYMSLVASKAFGDTTVPFIGSSGMFRLTSGSITKDYIESEDRLHVEVDGDLSMSSLVLSVSGYNMDSSKYVLPITNNLIINVNSGTTTISQDMAFLPGVEMTVADNATVVLASGVSVFIYDYDEWSGKQFVYSARDVSPLNFVGSTLGAPKARPTMSDAKIKVEGTLDASAGYLYTTTGGANICGTGEGEIIIGTVGTTSVTYQATQSGTDITFVDVAITPAQLLNGDSSGYVSSATTGTYYYHAEHQRWVLGGHTVTDTVIAPTCIAQGYTKHTCACGFTYNDTYVDATGVHADNDSDGYCDECNTLMCDHDGLVAHAATSNSCTAAGNSAYWSCSDCGKYFSDEACTTEITANSWVIPASGHTEVVDAAVAATCTETGLTEGKHCSVCGTVTVAQTVVDALGHSYQSVVTAPTCTAGGYTTHTCSKCGDSYQDSTTDATGHSYDSVVTAPTCTAGGYTTHTCSKCGDSYQDSTTDATGHSYDSVVTAPTCTTGGYTTHTCSKCGDTYTDSAVAALGHTEVVDAAVAATCTETGLTEGKHCSVCGTVTVAQTVVDALGHEHSVNCYSVENSWQKCSRCEDTTDTVAREYTIVFKSYADAVNVTLDSTYTYNSTLVAPTLTSNCFDLSYSWTVNGNQVASGEALNWADLESLIDVENGNNTITIPGEFTITGIRSDAISMSIQYAAESASSNTLLTVYLIVKADEGIDVTAALPEDSVLTLSGVKVENVNSYQFSVDLTADQLLLPDEITISFGEAYKTHDKVVAALLFAYSDALNNSVDLDGTSKEAKQLVAASVAYGAAVQEYFYSNPSYINTTQAPEVTMTDTYNNLVMSGTATQDGEIVIARFGSAQVSFGLEYRIRYAYTITLPAGASATKIGVIITDADNLLDTTAKWDGTTGAWYRTHGKDAKDRNVSTLDVAATELGDHYATVYVEYTDAEGNACFAYSQTLKYGVTTYLNRQIYTTTTAENYEEDEKAWKYVNLLNSLREIANLVESSGTNN